MRIDEDGEMVQDERRREGTRCDTERPSTYLSFFFLVEGAMGKERGTRTANRKRQWWQELSFLRGACRRGFPAWWSGGRCYRGVPATVAWGVSQRAFLVRDYVVLPLARRLRLPIWTDGDGLQITACIAMPPVGYNICDTCLIHNRKKKAMRNKSTS